MVPSMNRTFLLLLVCFLLVTSIESRKRVDCTKWVYAPACRGASKRDIQKLEPLLEEPRTPRYQNELSLDGYSNNQAISDNSVYDKAFFDTFLKKLSPVPKTYDYYNSADNC